MCKRDNVVSTVGAEIPSSYSLAPPSSYAAIVWAFSGGLYPPPKACCAACARSPTCVGCTYHIDKNKDPFPGPYIAYFNWEDPATMCDPTAIRFNFRVSLNTPI